MPQPKHPSLSLVLVLILGVLLGTVMSLTFKPIVELAFNSYHLFVFSFMPTNANQFSEVQKIIFFCIIDVTLVLGVIVPLLLVLQKKTNIQIT